jgi:hypothetical protein
MSNERAKRLMALLDDIRAESDRPVFDQTACSALTSGFEHDPYTGLYVPRSGQRAGNRAFASDVGGYLLTKACKA